MPCPENIIGTCSPRRGRAGINPVSQTAFQNHLRTYLRCRFLVLFKTYSTRISGEATKESAILRSCPVYYRDAGRQGPLIYHKLPEVWAINCQALNSSPLLTGWTPVSCCSRSNCKSRGWRNRAVGAVSCLSWLFKKNGNGMVRQMHNIT